MININLESLPIDVTEHIKKFILFLTACWPSLDELMEQHDWDEDGGFIDDWLQLNWEILVEREILENNGFLTPLSVPMAARVINTNAQANYSIVTYISRDLLDYKTKRNLSKNYAIRFFGFCSALKQGGFGLYPPFDLAHLVLDSTKELFIAPFSDLEFYLVKWP